MAVPQRHGDSGRSRSARRNARSGCRPCAAPVRLNSSMLLPPTFTTFTTSTTFPVLPVYPRFLRDGADPRRSCWMSRSPLPISCSLQPTDVFLQRFLADCEAGLGFSRDQRDGSRSVDGVASNAVLRLAVRTRLPKPVAPRSPMPLASAPRAREMLTFRPLWLLQHTTRARTLGCLVDVERLRPGECLAHNGPLPSADAIGAAVGSGRACLSQRGVRCLGGHETRSACASS